MFNMRFFTTLLAFALFSIIACNKDLSPEEQLQKDIEEIQKYLSDKGLTATTTDSGLHYIITQEGTGGHPTLQNTVTVKYKGYFARRHGV